MRPAGSECAVVLARATTFRRSASVCSTLRARRPSQGTPDAFTQATPSDVFAQGLVVPETADHDAERHGVTITGKKAHGCES